MAKEQRGLISSKEICLALSYYHTANITYATLEAILLCINALLSLFGTAANVLIITSYFRNRQLQTIQNFIFLVLAFNDLIVTALVQPLFIIGNLSGILGLQDCLFSDLRILISFFCIGLSMQTITILSLQSFIFLAFPYRCQTILTKSRLKIAVGACWVVVLFVTIVASVVGRPGIVIGGGLVIIAISLFIVTLTWIWTYRLVCRHRKTIRVQQTPSNYRPVPSRKVCRSAFTAFIIILSLFICYLPAIAVLTYRAKSVSSSNVEHRYFLLQGIGFTFLYANSLVNPCLVFWRSSVFRKTAMNLCKASS